MTNLEFVDKLKQMEKLKTCYMLGSWGMLTTKSNIDQAVARNDVDNTPYKSGAYSIENQGWMFDCVCMIKAALWGFKADTTKSRGGGAKYGSNGVPDIGADSMIKQCLNVSTDFSNIEIGEAVWVPGHIGVYIGKSQVIECTPRWNIAPDGVKVTNLGNHGVKYGWSRTWTKHGKLPYIDYIKEDELNMTTKEFVEKATPEEAYNFFLKAMSFASTKQVPAGDWQEPGLEWARNDEIIVGDASGNQMAYRVCTRGELAAVLKRFFEKHIKR